MQIWCEVNFYELVWGEGTGVAFAPKPSWVAFAPKWRGMKWVQGRMWPSFRGECDPCFCVAGAIVSEPQKDFFSTLESDIHVFFYVPTAISINFQDTMHATVFHCYVVTSISSNFQDALDVTFQETFQSTSRTLWMLRCKIQFEQLGRHFGCYVPTAIWINFQHTMDATL